MCNYETGLSWNGQCIDETKLAKIQKSGEKKNA
jgi:hypothetical protein